jgi:hypothetical protein
VEVTVWIADADIPAITVRMYAGHMASVYGASVAPKRESQVMRTAGAALRVLGIGLGERFMTHVVTTMGATIYVPFELGERGGVYSPWEQIAVLAHECQHVHERSSGGLARDVGYLLDTAQRTYTEATACTTSMELHHWRYGVIEGWWTRSKADSLHGYAVSDADVTHIHTHLISAAATIRRGGLITHAGRTAIAWLDEHAPELRAAGVAPRRAS